MTRLPGSASDWQRVKELLYEAMQRPAAERPAFLDRACGGDAALREEVEALLEHAGKTDRFEEGIARAVSEVMELRETIDLEGVRLGPWSIVEQIGVGGMGTVYLAERADGEFSKRVAIKVVRRSVVGEAALQRFRTERQILAEIEHPGIARLIDAGSTPEGLPYLVMEHVAGRPLDAYCDEQRLPVATRLELFGQVCAAVQAAHERRIVHRDLKPSNVLVTAEGVPKLLDFGIAKLLAPGTMGLAAAETAEYHRLLTPAFASPEQIKGEPVSPASDVYSLGVILYLVLSGHSPYDDGGRGSVPTEQLVCEGEPAAPGVAAGLDAIVLKALAKQPAARYANAGELGAALAALREAASEHAAAHASPQTPAREWQAAGRPQGLPARQAVRDDAPTRALSCDVPADAPPERWGHLHVVRKIGEGVFGEVFQCRDPSLDRDVALKLFRLRGSRAGAGLSSEMAARILREGRLLARVNHRNVVKVHGAGQHDGAVGLWMEYIDGETLEERLQAQGRYGHSEACLIGIEICSALAAVHVEGVVHRDIKAQNIIREEGGRMVLTDFGSGRDLVGDATWLEPGAAGTPLYMAPEVLAGGAATVRSDIYSLGVLLFRLVSGSFPIEAETWSELVDRHARAETPLVRDRRPDVPPRFARVIETALAADPARRYPSAAAMQLALEAATDMSIAPEVTRDDTSEATQSRLDRARPTPRRNERVSMATGIAAAAVVFVLFTGFVTFQVERQVMQIPPDFVTVSGVGYLTGGLSALFPGLVAMIIVAFTVGAPLFLVGFLLRLLERHAPRDGGAARWATRALGMARSATTRHAAPVANALYAIVFAGLVVTVLMYLDLWRAVIDLMDASTAAAANLEALGNPDRFHYTIALSAIAVGLLSALWLAYRPAAGGSGEVAGSLTTRVAIVTTALVTLLLIAAPWRTLHYARQPVVYRAMKDGGIADSDEHRLLSVDGEEIDLDGSDAFLIATNDADSWLYFPAQRRPARVGSEFVEPIGPVRPIF